MPLYICIIHLKRLIEQVQEGNFSPNIIYHGEEPVEYAVVPLTQYGPDYHSETFESVSEMLETYYASKEILTRMLARSLQIFEESYRQPWNVIAKN